MRKPKPTTHELVQASSNGGKLPDSFLERQKKYDQWLEEQKQAQAELEKEAPKEISDYDGGSKDSEKTESPKADNDFDSLPEDTEFPYHKGGGYYFLSNGEQVRGEDNAKEAQAELEEQ